MKAELKGVLPVLHMPYHHDYEIDFDTLGAEVDHVYACGADGIVFALASELLRLTETERKRVAEFLVEANRERGSVTISVGAESTFAAVQYARHAEQAGATAVMAIPPIATIPDEAGLRDYYGALCEAVSLPVVVQDASAYMGRPMSIAFQASLLVDYGERVCFKPEASPVGPLISALRQATGNRARILEGSGGAMLAENYRRGIAGTMPGSDLLPAIVALWRGLEANDEDLIYRIAPLIGAIQALGTGLDGYLAIEKYLLKRQGVFHNTLVRGPVGFRLDAALTAELDRLYERLQAACMP
jgi:4-hydroxy-tetrahydrodipicolinate synthase